jgi:MFS family permease
VTVAGDRRATYREVLAVREFRAVYAAHIASMLGDQAAKVALAVLVLDKSDNPLLAALAYAVGYLPWIVGGPVLSPLADRRPRREVMVRCDLVRALAIGAMALPHMPMWLLFALLIGSSLLMPPFEAARAATLPDVLEGDAYVVGSALSSITNQLAQVVGFVLGGAAVVALKPRGALLADAVSFLLSAMFIALGVKHRPAAARHGRPSLRADIVEGAAVVFRTPILRSILLLAWLGAAFSIVPEGLAVTYARLLDYGPLATGILTAALPGGLVVGALLIGRMRPRARLRAMRPMAAAAFVPLVLTAFRPPVWGAVLLWGLTGAGMAYQVPANATFMQVVPSEARGRAFGLAQSGIQAFQGLSIAGAGALALVMAPHHVIAVSGVCGLVAVAALGLGWPRAELAALHPPAVDESLEGMTWGDIPLEPQAPPLAELSVPPVAPVAPGWGGPYQLTPRPRTFLVRLLPLSRPAAPGEPAQPAEQERADR